MNPLYAVVATRAGFRCEYCRAPQDAFNFGFQVDHIHPRSAGGSNSPDNLALSCASCNGFKSDTVAEWDEAEAGLAPLFHPRRDFWEQHFVFGSELNQVLGLTVVGRVTPENELTVPNPRPHTIDFDGIIPLAFLLTTPMD